MRGPVLTAVLLLLASLAEGTAVADNLQVTELDYPDDLEVVRRVDWAWAPLQRGLPEHRIERITIHHGGVEFPDDKDPVEHLRALQSWSRSDKDWIDIPYHFMIDRQGRIYETRPINYPGDTNTEYDPAGHALVEVMGHYEHQVLSAAQLDAMVAIVGFLAAAFEVPVGNIGGHRDYADTTCPGEDVYRYLRDGTIGSRVAEALSQRSP
jgi:hypothetical protein